MNFKYTLPEKWVEITKYFGEFQMGAMQVTVRTKDGAVHEKVLLSNCMHPIAMRGHNDLPFSVEDITEIYQTAEDDWPQVRGSWDLWDDWGTHKQKPSGT